MVAFRTSYRFMGYLHILLPVLILFCAVGCGRKPGSVAVTSRPQSSFINPTELINPTETTILPKQLFSQPSSIQCFQSIPQGNGFEKSLLVGTKGGVYRLFRTGNNWKSKDMGLKGKNVVSIAYRSDGKKLVAAATNEGVYTQSGIFGKAWERYDIIDKFYSITDLAIAPDAPYELISTLIGGGYGCVYKSLDDGKTWTRSDSGIPPKENAIKVISLHSDSGAIWLVGTEAGLYRSTNRGASWDMIESGISPDVIVLSFHSPKSKQNVVFVGTAESGIFISSDFGATFSKITSDLIDTEVWGIATDPSDTDRVFAILTEDIIESTDFGANWKSIKQGMSVDSFTLMDLFFWETFKPGKPFNKFPNGLVLGQRDGSLRFYSSGNWSSIDEPMGSFTVREIYVDKLSNDVYAACSHLDSFAGIYKSTDGGDSWLKLNNVDPQDNPEIGEITIDPITGALFAGSMPSTSSLTCGVWKSTDGGSNWIKSYSKTNAKRIVPSQGALYLGANSFMLKENPEYLGLYRSIDSGGHWQRLWGPQKPYTWVGEYTVISAIEAIPPIIWVGVTSDHTMSGLWKSTDNGVFFMKVSALSHMQIYDISVLPSGNTIYVAAGINGVQKSIDGGLSWTKLDFNDDMLEVKYNPLSPSVIVAKGEKAFYTSFNSGSSWSRLNIPGLNVISFSIDWSSSCSTIYLGTYCNGVWKIELKQN